MEGTIALTYFPCAWCQPFNHSIDLIWFVTCLSHLGEKITDNEYNFSSNFQILY